MVFNESAGKLCKVEIKITGKCNLMKKRLKMVTINYFCFYISFYIYGSVNFFVGKSQFVPTGVNCMQIHKNICFSSWNKIKANPSSWFYIAVGFMQMLDYTIYDYWFMKDIHEKCSSLLSKSVKNRLP